MSVHQDRKLRAGNRALSYLISHYPLPDARLQAVIDSLPKFAGELYDDAQDSAKSLLCSATPNPLTRFARGIATVFSGARSKQTALANCIFDLQMTTAFSELSKHVGDNAIVSLLVDALIYQATGFETGSPTDEELLFAGTQNTRGIHKFQVAHKSKPRIGDIEAWTFGKEYSAIVADNPLDFSYIVSVSPFALAARVQARWRIRYLLYGSLPTEEDKQALEAALEKQGKDFQEMVDQFPKAENA